MKLSSGLLASALTLSSLSVSADDKLIEAEILNQLDPQVMVKVANIPSRTQKEMEKWNKEPRPKSASVQEIQLQKLQQRLRNIGSKR